MENDTTIELEVLNNFVKEIIESRYRDLIVENIKTFNKEINSLKLVVAI